MGHRIDEQKLICDCQPICMHSERIQMANYFWLFAVGHFPNCPFKSYTTTRKLEHFETISQIHMDPAFLK